MWRKGLHTYTFFYSIYDSSMISKAKLLLNPSADCTVLYLNKVYCKDGVQDLSLAYGYHLLRTCLKETVGVH